MKKAVFAVLVSLLFLTSAAVSPAAEELLVTGPAGAAKVTSQVLDENQLAVSVTDAEGNPIRGLGVGDFSIRLGEKEAKILSVETMEARKDIRLNIVLVLDNSYSMKKRNAVRPLLNALEEFLKIVRPIDNVQVVVFDGKGRVDANGRPMRVKVLHSKSITEIRHFLQNSYDKGLTDSTYLYEAMAAGIALVDQMPDKKNRFLLVFSDGDDINSNVDRAFVNSMAQSAGEFTAYAVDYMPTEKLDPFLRSFSEAQGGMAWKAASADTLVPIFKSFSTTLLYRYIVTYRFSNPPTGTLALVPEGLDFEMLTTLDGSPISNYIFFDRGADRIPHTYIQFSDQSQTTAFDEKALDSVLERYFNVLNVAGKRLAVNPSAKARIIGCNASVGMEKGNLNLSQRRAVRVRDYLVEIWGIHPSRLELGIRNLPRKAAPIDALGGSAENQRVEIVYDLGGLQRAAAEDFVVTKGGVKGFSVRPDIIAEYGVATWEVSLLADEKLIRNIRGTGELQSDMFFSLSDLGIPNLSASNSLQARINVTDINDDVFETTSNAVPIRVSKRVLITELIGLPRADLAFEPESLVIEEVTAIDSSPLLNFVYFDSGQSVIPDRYVMFKDKAKTLSFSQEQLKGTIEKSYHMLNIVGKRLREQPSAAITLVGCNSNYGPERKNLKLSRSRAEAVAAYLGETWGIDSSRMTVKARNLPAAPSTGRISEGRLENQRMEIHSDASGILDTVKSTYVEETGSSQTLNILPQIRAGYGVSSWRIDLSGGGSVLKSFNGEGDPESAYAVNLKEIGFKEIGACRVLSAGIEVTDRKGETFRDPEAASIPVTFIKREERVAKKQGYRVVEKYALILFDFDSSAIKDRNKIVVDRIVERMKQVPQAKVKIVGHTDNIGKESYNLKLSERRAKAVYRQLLAAGAIAQTIDYVGAGPYDPPFDNTLPEGRALNRTVIIYLEYEKIE